MRKFKVIISYDPIDRIREFECVDLYIGLDYCIFYGPTINPNDTSIQGTLVTNRILLIIPRENLISIEEIF